MGMEIHNEVHDEEVRAEFRRTAVAWLHEACGELASAVRNNQRVRTGRTRQSWRYVVDEEKLEGCVASDSENAVWEEFGTGEYALNGNGRLMRKGSRILPVASVRTGRCIGLM